MSAFRRPTSELEVRCEDVAEISGLYVLGALEDAEYQAITAHIATCSESHAEVREVGGVIPALAALVEPVDAPPALKARVMAAVAADAAHAAAIAPLKQADVARVLRPREAVPARAAWQAPAKNWHLPAWASWSSALAAVLIAAVVGVWALGVQSRASTVEQRAADLGEAVAAFSAPDSSIAVLRENAAGGSSGFAAIAADGTAYVVMVNLPPIAADQTYQAWYIVGDQATAAGLLTVGDDGLAVMTAADAVPGIQVVALTREPNGGSEQPTSAPFVTGEVRRQA